KAFFRILVRRSQTAKLPPLVPTARSHVSARPGGVDRSPGRQKFRPKASAVIGNSPSLNGNAGLPSMVERTTTSPAADPVATSSPSGENASVFAMPDHDATFLAVGVFAFRSIAHTIVTGSGRLPITFTGAKETAANRASGESAASPTSPGKGREMSRTFVLVPTFQRVIGCPLVTGRISCNGESASGKATGPAPGRVDSAGLWPLFPSHSS